MSFPYTKNLATYTAAYPGSVFTPIEFLNRDDNGTDVVDEPFAVPATPDADGKYRVNLGMAVLEQPSISIRVASNDRARVPWGEPVATGQVGLQIRTGAMEFHASDAGLTGLASYKGRGTPWMAHFAHMIQKELVATQATLSAIDLSGMVEGPASSTLNALPRFADTSGKLIKNSTVTLDDAGSFAGVMNISASGTLLTGAGSAAAPAWSFAADTNTGIWSAVADTLSLGTGGVSRLAMDTVSIYAYMPFFQVSGSATSPSYAFQGDSDTGVYRMGANQIGFATGATRRMYLDDNGLWFDKQFYAASGSASFPGQSFSADTNTGWFSAGADQLGGSCGGSQAFTLTSTGINNTAVGATTASTGRFTTLTTTGTSPSYSSPALLVTGATSGMGAAIRCSDNYTSFGTTHNVIAFGKEAGVSAAQFATHNVNLFVLYGDASGGTPIGSISFTGTDSTQIGCKIELATRAGASGSNTVRMRVNDTGQVDLPTATSATTGLVFGSTDTANLYRSAANTLKTDDDFAVGGGLLCNSKTQEVTANTALTTDDSGKVIYLSNGAVLTLPPAAVGRRLTVITPGFEDAFIVAASGDNILYGENTFSGTANEQLFNGGATNAKLELYCRDGTNWHAFSNYYGAMPYYLAP